MFRVKEEAAGCCDGYRSQIGSAPVRDTTWDTRAPGTQKPCNATVSAKMPAFTGFRPQKKTSGDVFFLGFGGAGGI